MSFAGYFAVWVWEGKNRKFSNKVKFLGTKGNKYKYL